MFRFLIFIISLTLLLGSVATGEIIKEYPLDANLTDLMLIGFGEYSLHALDVDGNVTAFENANPWLKDEWASNYRASLLADGNLSHKFYINAAVILDSRIEDEYRTNDPSLFRLRMSLKSTEMLWDGWRFTGEGVYDPQRQWEYGNLDTRLLVQPQTEAQVEMYARLESDRNGFIEGGTLRPHFQNTKFTIDRRSLFGAYANLHAGPAGVEAVAGKLEGKTFREGDVIGFRADGTSGPYDLSHAPVTRNSETVKIEVRDRFDETTVLSSETLRRDIDYDIGYEEGRILLYQPVASETASSDPVYIVITYDYQREADDDLYGGHFRAMPADSVQAGFSVLHRHIDDGASGSGIDEPEDLIGADFSFDNEGYGNGYFEYAGSDNPDEDDTYNAWRAGYSTRLADRLEIEGEFQRIEDDFKAFTYSDFDANKNQQRLKFGGAFDMTSSQNIYASYRNQRVIDAVGDYNASLGRLEENIYVFGYKNKFNDLFNLGLRVERRDIEDLDDALATDNRQDRAIADIYGLRPETGFLGKLNYRLHYELITYDNYTDSDINDANTNLAALTLGSSPNEHTRFEVTQRFKIRRDRELTLYDNREDVTLITARFQPRSNLSALGTAEYKRYTVPGMNLDFWQDDPIEIIRAGTFGVEYIPAAKFKILGKYSRHDNESWEEAPYTRSIDDFILGQLVYYHTHHVSIDLETEYGVEQERSDGLTERDRQWDLGVKLNWNRDQLHHLTAGMIRRWIKEEAVYPEELKSTSYIFLLSGSTGLGHGFYTRGSIKAQLLRNTSDDEKTFTEIELGYENSKYYRFAIGYERIENESETDDDGYYRGQGLYLRLSGRI